MEHPGWAVLVDWLNLRMKSEKLIVLNGNVDDFEAYLKKAHWLRGVTDALDGPKQIAGLLANEQERREAKA